MDIEFFCVSLPDNIATLKQSIPVTNAFYGEPKISIVCPDAFIDEFSKVLGHHKNVEFIAESRLITTEKFRSLMEHYAAKYELSPQDINRINWYYQQALKVSFALQHAKDGKAVVMLDADTILLEKVEFFKNGKSKLYGSLSEYHYPYFQTKEKILQRLPKDFSAFTVQFFSCTESEAAFLRTTLESYFPKESSMTEGEWIASIVIKSVMECHRVFKPAFFSEQELFGLSNKIFSNGSQEKIVHLRFGLNGPLDNLQLKFIKLLGFRHLTYEPLQKFTRKRQSWPQLIKHAIRELYRQRSGKIIRKAKRRIARLNRI